MLEELNWWMDHRKVYWTMWPELIQSGALVAVHTPTGWQREEIIRTRGDSVQIALKDWGTQVDRDYRDVYRLPNQFYGKRRPWKAIPCALAHIKPLGSLWPAKICQITRLIAEGKG